MIRIYARLQYLPDYIQTLVTTNTKFNPLFTIFRNASVRTIYNVRNSKSKRYSSFDTIHDRTYRARLRKLSINYRASTLILSNFVIERRIIITCDTLVLRSGENNKNLGKERKELEEITRIGNITRVVHFNGLLPDSGWWCFALATWGERGCGSTDALLYA